MKKLMVIVNIAVLTTARFPEERSVAGEEKVNTSSVKNGGASATPWLPFINLNSFPSFGFPGLRPNPALADKIKATKTEYIEVTRRRTVHPVCYTMYENKAPCLPHRSNDEEEPEMDVDIQHQINQGVHYPGEMSDYMKPVNDVLEGEREAKYLRFGNRLGEKIHQPAIAGNRQTEYVTTTTVLLTKLEKYTDHRVTATMVALNCFPVDPSIPRCRRYLVNPIIEVPLYGGKNGNKNSIVITPVIKPKTETDEEIDKAVEAVKKAAEAARIQEGGDPATEAPETR